MADGEGWSIQNSSALYGLDRWGEPYFAINGRGHISVQPQGERGGSLDLVACNDDDGGTSQSSLAILVTSGTTYYIEVGQP